MLSRSARRHVRRSPDTLCLLDLPVLSSKCILPCREPPLARRLTLLQSPACRLLRHFQCGQVGLRTSFESHCGGCGSVFGTSWGISVSPLVCSGAALDFMSLCLPGTLIVRAVSTIRTYHATLKPSIGMWRPCLSSSALSYSQPTDYFLNKIVSLVLDWPSTSFHFVSYIGVL